MQKGLSKISIPSMKLTAVVLAAVSALLLMSTPPAAAQTESVLYSFTGGADGANLNARLTLHNGNLYGTTLNGGAYGQGSIFQLVPNGSGGWTKTTLYSFCPGGAACVDGQNPYSSYVTFDSAGNLYGTALNGGTLGNGVVWELSPSGSGWLETVVHNFQNSPDGANPINGLIADSAGNLYGTTYAGGAAGGNGSIFELSKVNGVWTETPLYSINSNGSGLIIDSSGNIYGTSFNSVFELASNGQGGYIFSTLFTFNPAKAATQGSNPVGTLAFDSAGRLWGTTETGGANNDGVVYKLTKGTSGWTQAMLGSFNQTYGINPTAGLVFDSSGNMYGTTQLGGFYGGGTVYEISPKGKTYAPRIVFRFNGTDGGQLIAPLILDGAGYLYGTSYIGGTTGNGTVFAVNPHPSTTTTTLTSSQNPSTFGQAVTFTATVTSAGGTPANGDIVVFEPIGIWCTPAVS